MTGGLQTSSDGGGFFHCTLCGGDAAGPCARCKTPICGNCCVLTEHTAGKWALCLTCDRRGGRSPRAAWLGFALWLLRPILGLALVLLLLAVLFR